VPTLAVYCTQRWYTTADSPQQVVAYYEGLGGLRFGTPLRFRSEQMPGGGEQDTVAYCRYVVGYRSYAKISVQPSGAGAAIYVETIGGAQRIPLC
jgi:hypothetical protein